MLESQIIFLKIFSCSSPNSSLWRPHELRLCVKLIFWFCFLCFDIILVVWFYDDQLVHLQPWCHYEHAHISHIFTLTTHNSTCFTHFQHTPLYCPQIPSSKCGKTSSWRFLKFYKDKFFLFRKIIEKKNLKWAVLDETKYSLHLHKFGVVLVLAKFVHLLFLSSFNMMSFLFFSCTFL